MGRVFNRIDHIGVAVEDLDAALALYERDYAMTLVHRETVTAQGVEAVLLDVGMNHVAYQVDDIERVLAELKEAGMRLIDETPRSGIRNSLVAFLHPATAGG